MKKLFTLLLFAALFAGCDSDSDDTPSPYPPVIEPTEPLSFVGDVTATPQPGSRFEGFTDPEIVFDLTPAENGDLTLTMNRIKFVSQMPVRITFDIRDLVPVTDADGTVRFGVEQTFPYWNGEPYDPQGDGTYEVRNLTGTMTRTAVGTPSALSIEFDCYTMHVAYSGTRVAVR